MTHTLTICNVATSAMVRECKLAYITRAGVEIGVASTKAFTTQLAGLFLLTLALAADPRPLRRAGGAHLKAMRHLPAPAGRAGAGAAGHQLGRGLRRAWKTRCSWAAACTTRSRWKARSSSRRSPTSTPRPTRPASSSTARWRWSPAPCRWSRWRPTTRCWKSSRATCRRCARAAACCTCWPTPTPASRAAKACTSSACPSTTGCLSPLLHVVPLQLLAYHTAWRGARMWTSRATWPRA
jgi:hypothetical protein